VKKPKPQTETWTPRYKVGQVVKVPGGEAKIVATWGRSYQIEPGIVTDKPRTWFDESKLIEWEETL